MRQRYPESSKILKILKTYEKYSQFEAESSGVARYANDTRESMQRVDELVRESTKTLEALKSKPPVRIPELKSSEKTPATSETCMVCL